MTVKKIRKIAVKILPLVILAIVFLPGVGDAAKNETKSVVSFWEIITDMNELKMAIGNMILSLFAAILGLAGKLLNYSMEYTLSMGDIVKNVGVVDIGWKLFRDLANMGFIFILLYISIATILSIGNYKKILVNVVIAALLINFSLFATNMVIDASNILANAFYQPISNIGEGGVAGKISSRLNLNTIYKADDITGNAEAVGLGDKSIFTIAIMGSIFMAITAFVFLAVSVMLIVRVAVLMMLMILSPLAFLSFVLPGLKAKVFDKWWSTLIDQSFFAPIFMALLYVIVSGISTEAFANSLSRVNKSSFASAFTGGNEMLIVLNFILIIALIIAALNIAKSMSGKAGEIAMKYSGVNSVPKHARGVYTQTGGRLFSRVADSRLVKAVGERVPGVGRFITGGLDKMGGGAYNKSVKKSEDSKVAYAARVAKLSRGEEREKTILQKNYDSGIITDAERNRLTTLENTEKNRRDRVARSYERPGIVGEIIQRITGKDISERSVAKRIRRKESGVDPVVEAFNEAAKNYLKEKDGKVKDGGVKKPEEK